MPLSKIPNHLLKRYPLGYNHIVNGNFDFWQRATSQTTGGFGSDDYWRNDHNGTTKVHSRQAFIVGEVFPDGTPTPQYYSRTIVTSVAGAGNWCLKHASIPEVRKLAGKTVILSFYAKANANKKLGIEGLQYCGAETITGIDVQTVQLTTTWQKFKLRIKFPSLLGKSITTESNKSAIHFWFDAGSNFNNRSGNIGQQSGTFDIACVSLIEGNIDTVVIPRSKHEEFKLCTSMYETMFVILQRFVTVGYWGGTGAIEYLYQSPKYITPIVTFHADSERTLSGQLIRAGLATPVAASGLYTSIGMNKLLVWNNTILTTVGWYCYGWVTIDGSF